MIDRHISQPASGLVIASEHGDPFQQGGLSRTVLTDDDRDRPVETQFEIIAQERQANG
jgi:hypothetical protein